MPSFRASAAIIEALPGVDPPAVLAAARASVANTWQVEDSFVDVEPLARGTGSPRVTVRFVVPTGNDDEEDRIAWLAAKALAAGLSPVATWTNLRVFRRDRGRWLPVERPP